MLTGQEIKWVLCSFLIYSLHLWIVHYNLFTQL